MAEPSQATQKALALFHQTYAKCPAYKDFIDQHRLNPDDIQTPADFDRIPLTDRHNYVNQYSLRDRLLCDRDLSDCYLVTTSSGSTGKPTLWLRDQQNDARLFAPKEEFYKQFFQIDRKRTLIVVTFVLGMWIGGMLEILLAIESAKKHKLTIVTPGMNVKNSISAIEALHQYYDQVIVLGYPPFITDLMDAAKTKLDLNHIPLKFALTGDRFTEHFRTVLLETVHSSNPLDIVGMYACSDSGIIGVETPFSIKFLRQIDAHETACQQLFQAAHPPSLVTFNPMAKFVESVKNEIVITADQPVPLVRYNIHDRGQIISTSSITALAKQWRLNPSEADINSHYLSIYGRTDSVLVSAANVYIEDIKYCLQQSAFSDRFSEQFQFGLAETRGLKSRLKVNVYLKPGKSIDLEEKHRFEQQFYEDLKTINADFRVVQEGIVTENFLFTYNQELPDEDKYKNSKLKYFIQ